MSLKAQKAHKEIALIHFVLFVAFVANEEWRN
jgi:hypothetical protein